MVWLWPGLIKEILLFVCKVCTCSSMSVTPLINCMLGKSRLDSSLNTETKVEGHVVWATLQITASCHELWLLMKNNNNIILLHAVMFLFLCSSEVYHQMTWQNPFNLMFIYPNHGCREASANREASHSYTERHAVVSHCFVFTCSVNLMAGFRLIDKVDEGKQTYLNMRRMSSVLILILLWIQNGLLYIRNHLYSDYE